MGESLNPHVHDRWIFGPLGTLIYGFEYAKIHQKSKNTPGNISGILTFENRTWNFAKKWLKLCILEICNMMFDMLESWISLILKL